MLLQKISERFVCEFLQRLHPILRQPIERMEGLRIKLDPPAHAALARSRPTTLKEMLRESARSQPANDHSPLPCG
jgi:hypothetical protein